MPARARLGRAWRRAGRVPTNAQALLWACYFRRAIHHRPLPVLAALANPLPLAERPRLAARAVHDAFAIAARLPEAVTGPSPCLVRSLVTLRLLRACGEPARLLIGLPSFTTARPAPWRAHAWVDHPQNPEVPATYAALVPVPLPATHATARDHP